MQEQIAHAVGPDRLDIAYARLGEPSAPPVLLIMGLAAQMVHWSPEFIELLLGHGLQVLCFDNRDAGRSSHLSGAPPADLPAALAGDLSSVTYTLSDMAADAVGLLDALGIDSAHVVGASLGGAIGQSLAIEHPNRVRSLTSMMSTTGSPEVGQIHPATMRALFGGGPATTREMAMERAVRNLQIVGSPDYPVDPVLTAERAGLAWDRDHDLAAVARQAVASVASGDRTRALRSLNLPTLVVHGLADTMCDPSGARATAAAVPGAELLLIEGMGHNLPPGLLRRVTDAIVANIQRGEARIAAAR